MWLFIGLYRTDVTNDWTTVTSAWKSISIDVVGLVRSSGFYIPLVCLVENHLPTFLGQGPASSISSRSKTDFWEKVVSWSAAAWKPDWKSAYDRTQYVMHNSKRVLTQRDRATAVCCAYVWKVHCAVVRTLFQTWRHSAVVTKVVTVGAQCSECQREEIQKAWVNGRRNYDSLKPFRVVSKCSQCAV